MINSFFDIPREKLITIFPEIIRNSEEQYKSAIDISRTGKPGTAISLLLISSEEIVKALIVVLDARGFQFRSTKGMEVFFKNHEIRFFIGWAAIVASMFGEDFIEWIKDIKENPKKLMQQKEDYLNNAPYIEKKLTWYFLRKLIIIQKEIKWFSQAEVFRQNGFYCDMSGNLITPLKITDEQFEEARVRIEKVNKVVRHAIDAFLSEDLVMISSVEHIKNQFLENNFYDLISNKLIDMRKGRKSYFENFQKSFFDPLNDRNERKEFKAFSDFLNKQKTNINSNNTQNERTR